MGTLYSYSCGSNLLIQAYWHNRLSTYRLLYVQDFILSTSYNLLLLLTACLSLGLSHYLSLGLSHLLSFVFAFSNSQMLTALGLVRLSIASHIQPPDRRKFVALFLQKHSHQLRSQVRRHTWLCPWSSTSGTVSNICQRSKSSSI